MNGYTIIKEVAAKWNITVRQVHNNCKKGFISGVQKIGTNWLIPEDTQRTKYIFVCESILETAEAETK